MTLAGEVWTKKARALGRILPDAPPPLKVVVMPDFFLDHFLYYLGSPDQFVKEFMAVFHRKGGEIAGYPQRIAVGGNAANTSAALAALGANVRAIVKTSPLGLKILQHFLEPIGVDLSLVHADGELSLASNVEVEEVNVMFGDAKGLDLDFSNLTDRDLTALREANFVGVFNWLYNRSGTELAEGVFKFVKKEGVGKTFLDISDPEPKVSFLPELVDRVLKPRLVDVLGLNENEAYLLACQLDPSLRMLRGSMPLDDLGVLSARTLSQHIDSRVDLHTPRRALSIKKGEQVASAPTFGVRALRVTGAGDAWTAGDMVGEALGLEDEERLLLANAVAGCYISNPEAAHPGLRNVKRFLSEVTGVSSQS